MNPQAQPMAAPAPAAAPQAAPQQGAANPMIQQILAHILATHKHSLQQTGAINGGLLGLLKQQGAQPQAPAPGQTPAGLGAGLPPTTGGQM